MGCVLSWNDIVAGKYQDPDNTKQFNKLVGNELLTSPSVAGALLLGSGMNGDYNRRSDHDWLIIFFTNAKKERHEVMSCLYTSAQTQHRILAPIPLLMSNAQQGIHTVGSGFYRHMQVAAAKNEPVKQNPLQWITMTSRSTDIADTFNYVTGKVDYFTEVEDSLPFMCEYQENRARRKTLEAGYHISRKVLRLWMRDPPDGPKQKIAEAYDSSGPKKCRPLLRYLLALDREYTDHLEEQIKKPDEVRYKAMLAKIDAAIPLVLRFAQWNATAISRIGQSSIWRPSTV
jgi:hypothetical protein